MVINRKTYQAIIIGSGAGCGSLVKTLIQNNFDSSEILILERGSKMPIGSSAASRFLSTYENGGVVPCFGKPNIPFALANCVGGGPEINGSLIWKTPDHIQKKWFENYDLPFTKDKFEYFLDFYDKLLEVKNSHISDDHDYASYLINNASQNLNLKCVPARRSLKFSCCSSNLCAFGSTEDLRNTPLNKILKDFFKEGLEIIDNISNLNFDFNSNEGPYSVQFRSFEKTFSLRTKRIFLAAGAINSPLLLTKLKKDLYKKFRIKFHINLKSIGILKNEKPEVPGTMFSAQVQEYEKDDQYIMPFNWHKAHVATILDRHKKNIDFDFIFAHGLGVTSQVSTNKTESLMHVFNSQSKTLKFIKHQILSEPKNIFAIKEIMERTYDIFKELEIKKVLGPIKNSSIMNIDKSLSQITANKSDLDMLSVHHMASLPLGEDNIEKDGSIKGFPNIFVADASVLPTAVGESPQLTIMAFISSLYSQIKPLS